MNRLTIIGNLTRDPEMRTTSSGDSVCSFSVAVNRRKNRDGTQQADFFRVSAWGTLGESCGKYLAKGRKVAVVGSVSASAYTDQHGNAAASLNVMATDVEFLSSKEEQKDVVQQEAQAHEAPKQAQQPIPVQLSDDDLPF